MSETGSRNRTRLPGLFLLIAAVLNILSGFVLIGVGVQGHLTDIRHVDESLKRDFPGQHDEMTRSGWSLGRWLWNTSTGCIAMGVGGLISGGLAIAGVIQLAKGKTRLALIGAILMAIPGFSPSVCIAVGPVASLWMVLSILDESGLLPNQSA